MVAYRKSAHWVAWKCLNSFCGVVVVTGWGDGVGSTTLCGHTNFVFGLKLGCDNIQIYTNHPRGQIKHSRKSTDPPHLVFPANVIHPQENPRVKFVPILQISTNQRSRL